MNNQKEVSSESIEVLINRKVNEVLTIKKTDRPCKDLNSSLTEQIHVGIVNRDSGVSRNYK